MTDTRRWLIWGLIALTFTLAVVYWLFDPAQARWMPKCLWKVVTATDCPGCGSQRMIHALVHGDISGAWHANAFAFCLLPVMGVLLWVELTREKHTVIYSKLHHPLVISGIAVLVLVWWILRNLMHW